MQNPKSLSNKKNSVVAQIQKKRRQNHSSGIWGAEVPEGLLSMLSNACSNLWANKSQWGNDLDGAEWVKDQMRRQTFNLIDSKTLQQMGKNQSDEMEEDEQIVYMERSPAHDKLETILQEGKQFNDTRFPPNSTSLQGVDKPESDWNVYKWQKISDVLKGAQIFQGKPCPTDIKQGTLGDCYFMAALAALAERPDRIMNLFLTREVNKAKYYSVKLLYKGKWMIVDMDEFIPCYNSKPMFGRSLRNDLWVIILQKAWAKLYKSYNRIDGGMPREVLHDLTGAPVKIYRFTDLATQQLWKKLVFGSQKEFAMVASSLPGPGHYELTAVGIAKSHGYTLLNAFVLNFNGNNVKLVQLRNPWGVSQYDQMKGEYNGPWCDNDPRWNSVPQSQKKKFGYQKNSNDGLFFMDYESFLQNFTTVFIAQINDNASYVYKTLSDRPAKGVYFQVGIKKSGIYCFQINKTPQRTLFGRGELQNYQHTTTTIKINKMSSFQPIIYKTNPNTNILYELTLQTATYSSQQKYYVQYLNQKIDIDVFIYNRFILYIVYIQEQFNLKVEKDFSINLAVYSEYACTIDAATTEQVRTFNPGTKWNSVEHEYKGEWNELANDSYEHGDSGWGNYEPNKKKKQEVPTPNNNSNNNGWRSEGSNDTNGEKNIKYLKINLMSVISLVKQFFRCFELNN